MRVANLRTVIQFQLRVLNTCRLTNTPISVYYASRKPICQTFTIQSFRVQVQLCTYQNHRSSSLVVPADHAEWRYDPRRLRTGIGRPIVPASSVGRGTAAGRPAAVASWPAGSLAAPVLLRTHWRHRSPRSRFAWRRVAGNWDPDRRSQIASGSRQMSHQTWSTSYHLRRRRLQRRRAVDPSCPGLQRLHQRLDTRMVDLEIGNTNCTKWAQRALNK